MPTASESTYKDTSDAPERKRESPRRRFAADSSTTAGMLDARLWRGLETMRENDRRRAQAESTGEWWLLPRYDPEPPDPYVQSWLAAAKRAHARSDGDWRAGHESRIAHRSQFAEWFRDTVLPARADPRLQRIPGELIQARRSGTTMYRPADDRWCRFYDHKAGLRLLCPDDAREESDRLYRRYGPTLLNWMEPGSGHQVHYVVLTCPHAAPGRLADRMRGLFTRLRKVLFEFPCVTGAVAVMEAPLSYRRRWNVHLNVLVTTDGRFFDYGALRARWHWQLEARRLKGGEDSLRASVRELLKYSAMAVPDKSADKARAQWISDDLVGPPPPPPAPAMVEWTADEWLEWWDAHQRFRRTRSYRKLYKIGKPEPESMAGFQFTGWFATYKGRLFFRSPLLDSIQGDNSDAPLPRLDLETLQKIRGPPIRAPVSKQFGMFNR